MQITRTAVAGIFSTILLATAGCSADQSANVASSASPEVSAAQESSVAPSSPSAVASPTSTPSYDPANDNVFYLEDKYSVKTDEGYTYDVDYVFSSGKGFLSDISDAPPKTTDFRVGSTSEVYVTNTTEGRNYSPSLGTLTPFAAYTQTTELCSDQFDMNEDALLTTTPNGTKYCLIQLGALQSFGSMDLGPDEEDIAASMGFEYNFLQDVPDSLNIKKFINKPAFLGMVANMSSTHFDKGCKIKSTDKNNDSTEGWIIPDDLSMCER